MEKQSFIEKYLVPLVFFGLLIFGYDAIKTPMAKPIDPNKLEVYFFDVGQGDAAGLMSGNKTLLIDAGPDKKITNEIPALMHGSRTIDYALLSHPHADHASGFNYLFEKYEFGRMFITGENHSSPDYIEFLRTLKAKNIDTERIYAGKKYIIGQATVEVLWPPEKRKVRDLNDTSAVILVTYGNTKFLFLGDLSESKQDILADKYDLAGVDVLKVAHHGSKTGLSTKLLKEASPEYAVIPAGKDNYYGHPSPMTLSRLANLKVLRTDINKTIRFTTDGKELFATY